MVELKNLIVNGDIFGEFKSTINRYKTVVATSMSSSPDSNTIYILK